MNTYRDFEFPVELQSQPQPVVGFVGLDTANNTLHGNIWEICSSERVPDRVSLELILLPRDFSLPASKPKRASYEWYIPKGILKTNWMSKHLRLIPSMIVLFCELDWDDHRWSEKKLEIASNMNILKTAVEGRNIKIAIVLIQQSVHSINVAEDSLATERASEICTACDLNPKLLFLLHNNEHLKEYVIRLENAFHDLACSYYNQEIRNIKAHRDHLNRASHQNLFVRHQFKVAFFNELKCDVSAAHKHYMQANSSLLEIKVTNSNLNEIRVIAAFLTYKLCKIYFTLNQPRDAINQFNTHIERFRLKSGPLELIFEHYAWLSKQYVNFGQVFEEATRQGLPAVQTRHPGFYYEQAALYATLRKQSRNIPLEKPDVNAENDPLVGFDKLEYYGQRPWRSNNRSEALDTVREHLAVSVLQYRESYIVDHSSLIISYLGSAISQFKAYRSPRKRRSLAVEMADEYYSCKDYRQALTLFSHMLWEYRSDRWWKLTLDILRKALNCAYLTASLQEYVERCVEAMYLFPVEEKARIKNNLLAVTKNDVPAPEPYLSMTDLHDVNGLWAAALSSPSSRYLTVDLFPGTCFILCKATFCDVHCDAATLQIWLRNEFEEPVVFSRLSIGVGSQTKNTEYNIIKSTDVNWQNYLRLENREIKCIPFTFVPSAADIGTELQLKYVSLIWGNEQDCSRFIDLRFSGVCSEIDLVERKDSHLLSTFKLYCQYANINSKLSAEVKPRRSKLKLKVEHDSPCLIGEWYKVNVIVENSESAIARNALLQLTFLPLHSTSAGPLSPAVDVAASMNHFITDVYENVDGQICHKPYSFKLGDIEEGQVRNKILYFKTSNIDSKNACFKVIYITNNVRGEEMLCSSEEVIRLDCVNAFDVTASFLSCKCEQISKIYNEQPVLVRMQIDCLSPWPLRIAKTKFNMLESNVRCTSRHSDEEFCLRNVTLKNKEIAAELISFVVENATEQNDLLFGNFLIYWNREHAENEAPLICTEVQLPHMKVLIKPISVNVQLSSPAHLRTPLPMILTVYNHSDELMSFDVTVEPNDTDAFMYSGCKQTSFNLIPGGEHHIECNLLPLHVGYVPLPRIKVEVRSDLISQSELNDLLIASLPTSLFVMPRNKGDVNPSSPTPIVTK